MNILIYGASGDLAGFLAGCFLQSGHRVDLVSRDASSAVVGTKFATSISAGSCQLFQVSKRYSEFSPKELYDAYFFPQAIFSPSPLTSVSDDDIANETDVGFTDIIRITRKLLLQLAGNENSRRDFCFIGSTSAYAGFADTSIYCAVKHGLLGFVRSMNAEYASSDFRFWLFSMGTMNTKMGRKLTDQDATSFLDPADVAERIAKAISSPTNLFEPEVLIRRRTIRFREK